MGKTLEKAEMLHRQGKIAEAENWYLQALAEDFDNPQVLTNLGYIYMEKGVVGLAANLFKQALMLKKDHFEAWINLGNAYKATNREEDAFMCIKKALDIKGRSNRDYADAYNNMATLFVNNGNSKEGIPIAQKAIELNPEHPDAHWNLSLMLLEQGKYKEGFDLYKWGFKNETRQFRDYGKDLPYWNGESGKVVVVWGEQGIGDELMYASILPDVLKISKKVIFECHPRLVSIFKESFPEATIYGTRKDAIIDWPLKHPEMEAKIAIGDLGSLFRQRVDDFPRKAYLKIPPERVQHYRRKLDKMGGKPKIGISWSGGTLKTRRDYRSIPLIDWLPILKQDCDFISLQYTPDAYNAINEVEDKFDIKIHHWPLTINTPDYMETAALVENLDLIITINTSIHHLAGAMGKECWTLTPVTKAWRYYTHDGKGFSWYPSSSKIYQQEGTFEWRGVIDKVAEDLKEYIEAYSNASLEVVAI